MRLEIPLRSDPRRWPRLTLHSRLPLAAPRHLAGDDSVPPAPPRPGERPRRQDRRGRAHDASAVRVAGVRLRECSPRDPSARLWLAPCPPVGPVGQRREATGASEQSPTLAALPHNTLVAKRSEPGGPEGDTPQTEAQRLRPADVRRGPRLMDRRGRPPGPWGVRGAWEMAPRCRSLGEATVNPGPPEREEEQTMGPDHEGTTRPPPGKAHRCRPMEKSAIKTGPPPEAGRTDDGGPDRKGTKRREAGRRRRR